MFYKTDTKENSVSEHISLMDAAREYGFSRDYLRFLIFKNELRGEKIGRNWTVKREWVDEFLAKRENTKKTNFQWSERNS